MSSYTEPPIKRKNQSPLRILVNAWGCLLGLVMLGLGLVVGLFGALFVAPELLGFNLTATVLAENEIMLASTAADLDQRAQDAAAQATNFAFSIEATQANLLNEYELLGQTATQSEQNIRATGTAIIDNNIARQTQVMRDYQGTQAALGANSTEAALNIMNTQAALGITQPSNATPITSNQAVPSPLANNLYSFRTGLDTNIWQVSNLSDWQASASGLSALEEDAWLLEKQANLLGNGDYSVVAEIQASPNTSSDYWLLIVGETTEGIAAYLKQEGQLISEAALYSFDVSNLANGALTLENAALISRVRANSNIDETLQIELDYESGWLRLSLNGDVLMLADALPVTQGRFGIQLPQGAVLQSIEKR